MDSTQLSDQISQSIPLINNYQTSLQRLLLEWSVVSVVAKVNNQAIGAQFLDSISQTEKKFIELSELLISRIVNRYIGQLNINLGLHSQAFIDILNRNLFERSADIGFISQDSKIRQFFAEPDKQHNIETYLQEYIAKYSVYDDVILLDPELNVLARIKACDVKRSFSPCLQKALASPTFVESDKAIDLLPNESKPLVFAQKVTHNNCTVGLLCLSFKFEDELANIYQTLKSEVNYRYKLISESRSTLFDSHQSDSQDLISNLNEIQIDSHKNLKYANKTKPYQGYQGQNWQSHISINLAQAIEECGLGQSLLKSSRLYPQELNELSLQISKALNISISNGRVISLKKNSKSFLPILESYHEIGLKIREIFSGSITHIHQIANQTVESEVSFFASIALDILDRNLYERANDCRWWALNEDITMALEENKTNKSEIITSVIDSINELYSVYECIYVLDQEGLVSAVSNPKYKHMLGKNLTHSTVYTNTYKLNGTQDYEVSNFENARFYDNKPTYTYSAAIRNAAGLVIGSMAIVFKAETEFKEILNDFIPKNGNGESYECAFSMFVDSSAKIISVTENEHGFEVADKLAEFTTLLETLTLGKDTTTISFDKQQYIVGMQKSQGYREYQRDANNSMYCFVCVPS